MSAVGDWGTLNQRNVSAYHRGAEARREILSAEGGNGIRTLCECQACVLHSSKMPVAFNTVGLKEQRLFEAV